MSRYPVVLSAAIFFVVLLNNAMDQPPFVFPQQKLIKKIINIAGIQAMTFLDNNQIIILNTCSDPAKHRKPFLKVIEVFSNAKPVDLCPASQCMVFNPILVPDSGKTKVLCPGGRNLEGEVLVYDSQTKEKYNIKMPLVVLFPGTTSFGYLPNTIMFESGTFQAMSYNYHDNTMVLEEKITSALRKIKKLAINNYLPTEKIIFISSASHGSGGVYLYDLAGHKKKECLTERRATEIECSSDESFIVLQKGPVHSNTCPYVEYGNERVYTCDCNRGYIVNMHDKECISLHNNDNHRCSIAIHPNNKCVATLSGIDNVIQYWCAKTGKYIAEHQSPTSEIDKLRPIPYDYSNKDRLSFSADGTMLAVIFPTQCVIYNVPFKVIYGIEAKNKLTSILLLLKNYQNGLLPQELVQLLMKKIVDVSKL
jgi:WD40 repeat protein